MEPLSLIVCPLFLAVILAVGAWVWADHRAETRRREQAAPLPGVQIVAVGIAPVPPRTHRARRWAQ